MIHRIAAPFCAFGTTNVTELTTGHQLPTHAFLHFLCTVCAQSASGMFTKLF
jgi:hypothetical protein